MNCTNCGTANDDAAKFCRDCGKELVTVPENIMDRHPKLKLRPTTIYNWKEPTTGRFLKRMFSTLAVIGAIVCLYSIISCFSYHVAYSDHSDYGYMVKIKDDMLGIYSGWDRSDDYSRAYHYALREYRNEGSLIGVVVGGIAMLVFWLWSTVFNSYCRPKETPDLRAVADYVQEYTLTGMAHGKKKPLYKFFVKNGRFGLLNVTDYCVQIPADYDMLEWREKGRLLQATTSTGKYVIDINGKQLR